MALIEVNKVSDQKGQIASPYMAHSIEGKVLLTCCGDKSIAITADFHAQQC